MCCSSVRAQAGWVATTTAIIPHTQFDMGACSMMLLHAIVTAIGAMLSADAV
jgi:hypothetical protein